MVLCNKQLKCKLEYHHPKYFLSETHNKYFTLLCSPRNDVDLSTCTDVTHLRHTFPYFFLFSPKKVQAGIVNRNTILYRKKIANNNSSVWRKKHIFNTPTLLDGFFCAITLEILLITKARCCCKCKILPSPLLVT